MYAGSDDGKLRADLRLAFPPFRKIKKRENKKDDDGEDNSDDDGVRRQWFMMPEASQGGGLGLGRWKMWRWSRRDLST